MRTDQMKTLGRMTLLTLLTVGLSACWGGDTAGGEAGDSPTLTVSQDLDLVGAVDRDPQLQLLGAALKTSRLEPLLRTEGPFTLVGPRNRAWNALGGENLQDLLLNERKLKDVLRSHLVPEIVDLEAIVQMRRVKTANGKYVRLERAGDGLLVNGAPATVVDTPLTNGQLLLVDELIVPVTLAGETVEPKPTGPRPSGTPAAAPDPAPTSNSPNQAKTQAAVGETKPQFLRYEPALYAALKGERPFVVYFGADWVPTSQAWTTEMQGDFFRWPAGTVVLQADFTQQATLRAELGVEEHSRAAYIEKDGTVSARVLNPTSAQIARWMSTQ